MKEIFERVSTRNFSDREVEDEKLDKILRAAMQAPSAGNQRPWNFYVVKSREALEELSKSSPYASPIKNGKLAIVITYSEDVRFPELCQIDCAIATENIYLACESLGLGTVMLAVAPFNNRMDAVSKALKLPSGEIAFTMLPIGYPLKKEEAEDRYDESRVHIVK